MPTPAAPGVSPGTASTTSDALDFDGCRLSFATDGAGPPVMFIQGVGVGGRGWLPQVRDLRARFTCLSFDNRRLGASQPTGRPITVEQLADDARALMDHLGWESAHVVGHSLGGPIALDLARRDPRRIRSLSLLCTVARGADATRLSPRMLSIGLRSRIGPRRSRRRAFMEIVSPVARRSLLFDQVPERLGIVANPGVPGHDDGQRRRLTQQFRGCQVHGIERPNRLHGKGPAHAREDWVRDGNHEASPLEAPQCPNRRSLLAVREPFGRPCAQNRPGGFGKRERRSDLRPASADRLQSACLTLQQRGDQRARLDISKAHRARAGNPRAWPRLRHDRCR